LPCALIATAELLIFEGQIWTALAIHCINLIYLTVSSAYSEDRAYQALMLLPLFRLLNIAMPIFFTLTLYSYPLIYAPMFIPMYFLARGGGFSLAELGITSHIPWSSIPMALGLGLMIGYGEYNIIHPQMLVPDGSIKDILILATIMTAFVGLVEEFIFRSCLQTVFEERMGPIAGLVAASLLFGVMHSGYGLAGEMLFVSAAGLAFGLFFQRTRSLLMVSIAHGVTNISLFMVVPGLSDSPAPLLLSAAALFAISGLCIKLESRSHPNAQG
jgi:uncharacterized protein